MTEAERSKYDGRDMVILNRHTEDTIQEDKLSFPMQMEKVLVQFPELGSNYLITLETVNNQDEMIVEVELSDLSTDNYIELQKISKAITRQLKDEILVTPKLRLVKKGSLPQSEGKAVRVKDLRDNK